MRALFAVLRVLIAAGSLLACAASAFGQRPCQPVPPGSSNSQILATADQWLFTDRDLNLVGHNEATYGPTVFLVGPGSQLHFYNGSSLIADSSHRFFCVGTAEEPIEFHFWPDENGQCGQFSSQRSRFSIPQDTGDDSCFAFAPNYFTFCKFIAEGQQISSLPLVDFHDVMKVRFDHCAFSNAAIGILLQTMKIRPHMYDVDDIHELVFEVTNCLFENVDTGISCDECRDHTTNCELTSPEQQASLGFWILNNRFKLRPYGTGLFFDRIRANGFGRTQGDTEHSEFAIEGNTFEGIDNSAIGCGIRIQDSDVGSYPELEEKDRWIGNNYIEDAVGQGILLDYYPGEARCRTNSICVVNNIVTLAEYAEFAITVVSHPSCARPRIGANVLITYDNELAPIQGEYVAIAPNYDWELPADYESHDYHLGIDDTDFLFVGPYTDVYGHPSDMGVFGGPRAPLREVYHVVPDDYEFEDVDLPSYGYLFEGRADVGIYLGIGQGSWLAFADSSGGMTVSGNAQLVGTNLLFTSHAMLLGALLERGEESGVVVTLDEGGGIPDPGIRRGWEGLRFLSSSFQSTLTDVTISDAEVGIQAEARSNVRLVEGKIADCRWGLLGGVQAVLSCEQTEFLRNACPLVSAGSDFGGDGMLVEGNRAGVYVAGGNFRFKNSEIRSNGIPNSSSLAKAGLFVVDGTVTLRCCFIEENWGPGLYLMNNSVVDMGIDQYNYRRHNSIANNRFSSQIVLSGTARNLALRCGDNRILPLPINELAVQLINPPQSGSEVEWEWNYWGVDDCDDIGARLAIEPFWCDADPCLTSWSSPCPQTPDPCYLPSPCTDAYLAAVEDENAERYTLAKEKYQEIIEIYADCEYAFLASSKLPVMDALGAGGDNSRDYLRDIATASPATPLEKKAYADAAWIALAEDKLDSAAAEFDSLLTWATDWQDSLPALSGRLMADYFRALDDPYEGRSPAELLGAAYDSLFSHTHTTLASYRLMPMLEHAPEQCYTAETLSATLSCRAFAEEATDSIAAVIVHYRSLPQETWLTDTLSGSGADSIFSISIPLDSLGGALEYHLMATDSRGRIASQPEGGFFSSEADLNPSYVVSFEPRLTHALSDTAYLYAPSRLTRNLIIEDYGVLHVRPSPLRSPSIVSVDSGVGITVVNKDGRGRLIIAGTAEQEIIVTAEDSTDGWRGIFLEGGRLDAEHFFLAYAEEPLVATRCGDSLAVLRMSNGTITHSLQAVHLQNTTDISEDSSALVNVTIEETTEDGLLIEDGTLVVDGLSVEECMDYGLVVHDADGLTVVNSAFIRNHKGGLSFDPGASQDDYEVRFEGCLFSNNGVSEIHLEKHGILDLSNGAGNTLQDSTGHLLYISGTSGLQHVKLENGSNMFRLLGTSGGTYFRDDSLHSPYYITGNYFYPVDVADAAFTDDMEPDSLNAWVYSYLRAESLNDTVIANPGDSLEFSLRAYAENFLGIVAADTITEIGFKWRLLPDSANWTTERITSAPADCTYGWWVRVGDNGGLVNYIFWIKDAHGRFVASPLRADTTDPENGPTHFTSFEMQNSSFWGDSITLWAPTVISQSILLDGGAKLVIKPWPGASEHTVRLSQHTGIQVGSMSPAGAELILEGTPVMPLTLEPAPGSPEWSDILVYWGAIRARYTTFQTSTWAVQIGHGNKHVAQFDHCIFDGTKGYAAFDRLNPDSSYLRDCVFRNSPCEDGVGSLLVFDGGLEVTDCWFYDNEGYGLFLYEADDVEISGCNSVSNDWNGLYLGGASSCVSFSCNEFSFNGGDSTAEVLVDAGTLDFSSGSNCVFADDAGPLLEGAAMASFELVDGENGFFLFDSLGSYIVTDDESDTMNISGNFWHPYDPDTLVFWDYLVPDTSRFWISEGAAAEVGSCGEGGIESVPGMPSLARVSAPAASAASARPLIVRKSSPHSSSNSAKATTPIAAQRLYDDAVLLHKARDYGRAAEGFAAFLDQADPSDDRLASALTRHFACSRKANSARMSLSEFYAAQERRVQTPYARRTAHALFLESLALEGKPQAALSGYEEMMRKPLSVRDSVQAVIGAMRMHYRYGRDQKLNTAFPENRRDDFRDLIRRTIQLTRSVPRHHHTPDAVENSPTIPTEYRLQQNYPNPFNPVTEIRFDLPEAVRVKLAVFNILGQEVTTLVDQVYPAGTHLIAWNGESGSGISMASGVYVYRIQAGEFTDSKKMVLIR